MELRVVTWNEPSVGKETAPVGSEDWANNVRLHLGAKVSDLSREAETVASYFVQIFEQQAWKLLRKKDGQPFADVEEFCATDRPWGLSKPWPLIRPHLLEPLTKRGIDAEKALSREAVVALRAETAEPEPMPGGARPGAGRPSKSAELTEVTEQINQGDNITLNSSPRGTGSDYLTARIARDAPEVLERMKAGEFSSVRKAAIEAGIVKQLSRVDKAMALVRRMTTEELYDFESAFNDHLAVNK